MADANEVQMDEIADGELLKWDKVGIQIVGILKSYKEQNTANGIGHVYEVQTKDGLSAFFAPSLLQKKLKQVKIGNIVRITYTEVTKTAAGNPLKHFKVGNCPATEANLNAFGLADLMVDVADELGEEPDLTK